VDKPAASSKEGQEGEPRSVSRVLMVEKLYGQRNLFSTFMAGDYERAYYALSIMKLMKELEKDLYWTPEEVKEWNDYCAKIDPATIIELLKQATRKTAGSEGQKT
jgi:hypothetical protein